MCLYSVCLSPVVVGAVLKLLTSLYLLLQVNNGLKKELSSLRDIVDQHNKSNRKTELLNKVN